jgi:hypothetical protein
MKISQIINEDEKSNRLNRRVVNKHLTDAGYRKIGSGGDSLVYTKDKQNVVKVIVPRYATPAQADKIYQSWLSFCAKVQRGKSNPHLPMVTQLPNLTIDNLEFSQYQMPKYREIDKIDYEIVEHIRDTIVNGLNYEQYLQEIASNQSDYPLREVQIAKKLEPFYRTATAVIQMSKRLNVMNDFGLANVMKDNNGVYIITDPWNVPWREINK